MTTFIKKKEAISFIGKSEGTLRKWRDSITKTENHPDRDGIKPNASDVAKYQSAGRPFEFAYSKELLARDFDVGKNTEQSSTTANSDNGLSVQIVALLQEQLAAKDEQLRSMAEANANLVTRLGENNVLLKTLQEKLPAPSQQPSEPKPKGTEDAKPAETVEAKATTAKNNAAKKARKGTAKKKKRKWAFWQ